MTSENIPAIDPAVKPKRRTFTPEYSCGSSPSTTPRPRARRAPCCGASACTTPTSGNGEPQKTPAPWMRWPTGGRRACGRRS